MTDPGTGPVALDPDSVAFHQLVMFAPARSGTGDALERSRFFRVERSPSATVAEWMLWSVESDPCTFPLGRARLHADGVLLEAFSERRLSTLRTRLRDAGAGEISGDQIRVLRVSEALRSPEHLVEPRTPRGVAELYLRMAWPFFRRADLDGRTPNSALSTGRGRAAVERVLASLPEELPRSIPGFPVVAPEDLARLLLPAEPALPAPPRGERSRPRR